MEIKFIQETQPQILVSPEMQRKMEILVAKSHMEVGWLGLVERLSLVRFQITDILIPVQEVHSTTTEITPDGLGCLANEVLDAGGDLNKLRLWGH